MGYTTTGGRLDLALGYSLMTPDIEHFWVMTGVLNQSRPYRLNLSLGMTSESSTQQCCQWQPEKWGRAACLPCNGHLHSECLKNSYSNISWILPALSRCGYNWLSPLSPMSGKSNSKILVIPQGACMLVFKSNCFCYIRSVYGFSCPCFHYYFNQNGKFSY